MKNIKTFFLGERFKKLEKLGAKKQKVLWASTSTKDPSFSDVKYVEALIGPNTINTLPLETIEAFRDHGKVQDHLENNLMHSKNGASKIKRKRY